jgi:hypothetical protein
MVNCMVNMLYHRPVIWIVIQHTLVTTVQQNYIHKTKVDFLVF